MAGRRHDGLTVDEAAAIADHARAGRLDQSDPEIRRLVGEANRMLVRAQVWGDAESPRRRRKRRWLAAGAVALVTVWVAGLLVPLLVRIAE